MIFRAEMYDNLLQFGGMIVGKTDDGIGIFSFYLSLKWKLGRKGHGNQSLTVCKSVQPPGKLVTSLRLSKEVIGNEVTIIMNQKFLKESQLCYECAPIIHHGGFLFESDSLNSESQRTVNFTCLPSQSTSRSR